ncbi:MAG: phosphate--acyl-ACP acyltransferase, partial [Ruminiclostridium sp.]|nr:phosphate--acyl-ACP acyltransferase [Ruminiclostridium sp.]
MMKIAVDAFGGDHAPDEVLKGAVEAVKKLGVTVVLTGDEALIYERFRALGLSEENIEIVNANGVIRIEDNPLEIRKSKADSAMGTAFRLVAEG